MSACAHKCATWSACHALTRAQSLAICWWQSTRKPSGGLGARLLLFQFSFESAGTIASLPRPCLGSEMKKLSWYIAASRCPVSVMGQVSAEQSSVYASAERWQLAWHQDLMLSGQCTGSNQCWVVHRCPLCWVSPGQSTAGWSGLAGLFPAVAAVEVSTWQPTAAAALCAENVPVVGRKPVALQHKPGLLTI